MHRGRGAAVIVDRSVVMTVSVCSHWWACCLVRSLVRDAATATQAAGRMVTYYDSARDHFSNNVGTKKELASRWENC
jgi:hypothetical protein